MTVTLSPTQSDVQTVLRSFLIQILPAGIEVVEGQDNRVPEPADADFVVMTPIRKPRLSTNVDSDEDAAFTASISGATMNVTNVLAGALSVGSVLYGTGVSAGTTVTAFGSGSGGVGTYTVSPSQTVGPVTISAGTISVLQANEVVFQLDVHGPASSDNAETISTMMRDAYAVDFFSAANASVAPFFADDPRQMPYVNDQNQVEMRWVVEAHLQANQTVSGVPQEFASAATVTIVDVDAAYPPS